MRVQQAIATYRLLHGDGEDAPRAGARQREVIERAAPFVVRLIDREIERACALELERNEIAVRIEELSSARHDDARFECFADGEARPYAERL